MFSLAGIGDMVGLELRRGNGKRSEEKRRLKGARVFGYFTAWER